LTRNKKHNIETYLEESKKGKEPLEVIDYVTKPAKNTIDNQKLIRAELINRIGKGQTLADLRAFLKETGASQSQAERLIYKARLEIDKALENSKHIIVNQNILILQNIVKDCLDAKRYKDAISALSELNKIVHAYDTKIEVNVQNYGFSFDMGTAEQIDEVEYQNVEVVPDDE